MRTLLCSLLLLAACKPKLELHVDAYHSVIPNTARVTVTTVPKVTIEVAGLSRTTATGREFFDIGLDKLPKNSSGDFDIHVEVHRGGERLARDFRLAKKIGGPAAATSGKYGVQLLAGSEGDDFKVSSPLGPTITVGTPPALVFQVTAGVEVAVAGAPLPVENGKAVWVIELEKLVTQVPTSDLLPGAYRPAKAVVPVRLTDGAGPHDEKIEIERPDAKLFVSTIENLIEPVRHGKPVDLGPSASGGFIVVSGTGAGHTVRTGGPMATLKDATVAVWQTASTKSGGRCSYVGPRSGKVSVPVTYGTVELAAYDLRKGKLKKKVVLRGKGARCPAFVTSYGGSVGSVTHEPLQSEIDSALSKLTH